MKIILIFLFSTFVSFASAAEGIPRKYVASTPAHLIVRDFLQISLTDSIDFIRWDLEMDSGVFKLSCRYGLSQPSTPGFSNEKRVDFEGQLTKSGNYYKLTHKNKSVSIFEMNSNVLHFLDHDDHMLIGNGGYSYALNNINPVTEDKTTIHKGQTLLQNPLVFEGRTPCQELSAQLGMNKSEACNKMKWYFLLYTDSVTGKPSHFLNAGIGYVKASMNRGTWKIVTQTDGRISYELSSEIWTRPLVLLKGDDNILFFVDPNGQLLVGNNDFSYTLNRKLVEYAPVKR